MIDTFIALDLETTGLSPVDDRIIEIGAVKIVDGVIVDTFNELVNPNKEISQVITNITGITNKDVENAKSFDEICGNLIEFLSDYPILGHNIIMDYSMLKESFYRCGIKYNTKGIDTLLIARKLLPHLEKRNLTYLTEYFNIEVSEHHRAYSDALASYELYKILSNMVIDGDTAILEPKDLVYKIKKVSKITVKQLAFLNELITRKNVVIDKELESLTKSEASRLIDQILSGSYRSV